MSSSGTITARPPVGVHLVHGREELRAVFEQPILILRAHSDIVEQLLPVRI